MSEGPTLRTRVPSRLWDELVAGVPVVHVAPNEVIYGSRRPPRVAAILAGTVRIVTWTPTGHPLTIRHARAGDMIGLATLLSASQATGAEAVTAVTLALPPIERVRALASRHPELSWAIAEQVATWAAEALESVVRAGFHDMEARVARQLLDLSATTPDGAVVAEVTHRGLAEAVGTAREVITRTLRTLREQGVIETGKRQVVILDRERLARIAAG